VGLQVGFSRRTDVAGRSGPGALVMRQRTPSSLGDPRAMVVFGPRPGGPVEQHVVEGLAAVSGGFHGEPKQFFEFPLARCNKPCRRGADCLPVGHGARLSLPGALPRGSEQTLAAAAAGGRAVGLNSTAAGFRRTIAMAPTVRQAGGPV